jgi:ferredoxin
MVTALSSFEQFLQGFEASDWDRAVSEIMADVHEVDRTATSIWFKFYPLALYRALAAADDSAALAKRLLMQGNYKLKDQIGSSHQFLYGHRFWPQAKQAVEARTASFAAPGATLSGEIRAVAGVVAQQTGAAESLTLGISAVALMTLVQSGLALFKAAPAQMLLDKSHARRKPEQVLAERARDDSQGPLGFLRTIDKKWSVCYNENKSSARFRIMDDEQIASAAAKDQSQNWSAQDARCIEGPIPVECRSAACGTCWVGVLGGREKLSDVATLEGKRIKQFGYINTDEAQPEIRLACMAQARGTVSIVIPPWNGVFGKQALDKAHEAEAVAATQADPVTAT